MVLRRYTPPTCTLEITAKTSPLSRWAGQPVLKSLRFELRLDDPRLSEEKHVTLKGDRDKLEVLHQVVSTYIQNLLGQSLTLEPKLKSTNQTAITDTDLEQKTTDTLILDETRNPFAIASNTEGTQKSAVVNSSVPANYYPRLEAQSLLTHNLFLGELENEFSGSMLELSTLQLFDLATALDEYAAEVLVLPNLKRSSENKNSQPWLKSAAAVILTVGLTTGAIKLLDRSGINDQTAAKLASPSPTAIATKIYPSPLPTVPPPPLAKPSSLPVPTLVPSPTSTLPAAIASPTPIPIPAKPVQAPPLLFPQPPAAKPESEPERVVTIPGDRQPPVSQENPIPRAPKPAPIARNPLPDPGAIASSSPPSELSNLPNPSAIPGVTELPPLADAPIPSPIEPQENTQTTGSNSKRTLFDTIPQVTEARTYFEQNWSPPVGLKETLEYSLQLDASGAIQQIVPRGKAAGDYIDRTKMPLVGEPFVSAVENGKTPRIRLVLRPNGKVQTFLESLN
ncbi:hypothetical protein BCD67_23365 [Oscillatoriales cyanobacterium USR001]|nr:hypothetical protein BCD67_23365 [Oscillatoriales cyanobacterium USR001]